MAQGTGTGAGGIDPNERDGTAVDAMAVTGTFLAAVGAAGAAGSLLTTRVGLFFGAVNILEAGGVPDIVKKRYHQAGPSFKYQQYNGNSRIFEM